MTIESKQTQKGFTLIELMIVVAIIGILASIAIPQFSQFRVKAFNSAALSDIHSARLSEEVVYTDYQTYGGTVAGAGLTVATAIVATPEAGAKITANGFIATATIGMASPVTVSSDITLAARASAVASSTVTALSATITVQHLKGDKTYVSETDQPGLYQKTAAVGTIFAAAVAATDDITTADATAANYIKLN